MFRKKNGSFRWCASSTQLMAANVMVVTLTGAVEGRAAGSAQVIARLSGRCHGSLDLITDSGRRGLRPIGRSVREVTASTFELLGELLDLPGVRIFQGVRSPVTDVPRTPLAISVGRQLILIEPVAWPSGRYATTRAGRILSDGMYIGQSIRPLLTTIRHWQESLPASHRVCAVVVVHPIARDGDLLLPVKASPGLAWVLAGEAVGCIRAHLPGGRQPVSMRAVAALVAATAADRAAGEHGQPGTAAPQPTRHEDAS
jgi:hypothetical protein